MNGPMYYQCAKQLMIITTYKLNAAKQTDSVLIVYSISI